jgi:hypothetical protein
VERAIDLLTQATTADREGRKEDAIALYTKGVEYLFAANRCACSKSCFRLAKRDFASVLTVLESSSAPDLDCGTI